MIVSMCQGTLRHHRRGPLQVTRRARPRNPKRDNLENLTRMMTGRALERADVALLLGGCGDG